MSHGLEYTCWDPGSIYFGEEVPYDYSPNSWEMIVGESLVIETPRCIAVGYLPRPFAGDWSQVDPEKAGYYDNLRMLEKFGYARLQVIGANPDDVVYDAETGDVKMVGPFYPIMVSYPGIPWLLYEPAPRIEIWI